MLTGSTNTELDAAWDATRATSRLRALGVRRGYRGPRRRPATGWDSLTDTERAVADLVAQGLPNPDVAARLSVSRRTVQTHVFNILNRLDLASRVELASEVTRRSTASIPNSRAAT